MKSKAKANPAFRAIPAVQDLLSHPDFQAFPIAPPFLKQIIQENIEGLRQAVREEKGPDPAQIPAILTAQVRERLEQLFAPRLKRLINATGIILHTNMGRAPLARPAREALQTVSENYCNIEIDLQNGKRSKRQLHVEDLLCLITGAEAAIMVNNCAAGVLLTLSALCAGCEVPVSRGELVEIGGSFRMPEVMKSSGTTMVEIGTTNKTHLRDYQNAITPQTAALLKVHTSNFRVLGFTDSVGVRELATLAEQKQLPLIYDMGSGVINPLATWGLDADEPSARQMLEAGVDVLIFSGDKMLGGPQAGIIAGKKRWIDQIRNHHLARALRCDKLVFAAMAATLPLYLNPEALKEKLPVTQMLNLSVETLRERAEKLLKGLPAPWEGQIVETTAQMGSGTLPLTPIPSIALVLRHAAKSTDQIAAHLRHHNPPVIGYIQDDRFWLNLRTVREDELAVVAAALS